MTLLPARFLFRVSYLCRYIKDLPKDEEDHLLDLPEACRIENFAAMEGAVNFADVRLAWNEKGLAIQVEIRGKERPPQGDESRPRGSDGLTIWLDTRDARTSHRASKYCYQFTILPTGGGPEKDEPVLVQGKINRALENAPTAPTRVVPFRSFLTPTGYRLEVFLPEGILSGFDPEQNSRLGFYYAIRDGELGEQVLSVGPDFPYWEDPSLWRVLELQREK
jgi:hypothetical protein